METIYTNRNDLRALKRVLERHPTPNE